MLVTGAGLISNAFREVVQALEGQAHDYDPVLALVGNAPLCLLGETTHGTHEFYRERAEITKRLIKEKGLTAVAVKADWPDAFRVNCYVRTDAVLVGFTTYEGTVTAASDWDGPAERKRVTLVSPISLMR